MLFAITPLQRGHGRLRLPDRDSRFQASSAAHEADATHQAIFCYPGGFKRLGDEYFGVTSKPGNGQIRQYPHDCGSDTVQRDAAAENHRIGIEAFSPETFRHQCDVRVQFLLRQKISAKDRTNAEQIEIICRHIGTEQLGGIALAGHDEAIAPIGCDARKDILPIAIVPELRHGKRQLF